MTCSSCTPSQTARTTRTAACAIWPTTSLDRDVAGEQNRGRGGRLAMTGRTLYLMRGTDRSDGRNDYQMRY